jgi:hypothetical protein
MKKNHYPGSKYPKHGNKEVHKNVDAKSGTQTDGGAKYDQIKVGKYN